DGCSTGGRQGYNVAQNHPTDYDGYLNGAPAFNWTKFITNELYPQVVVQRDLGGVSLTTAQQNLVGGSAVSACDVVGGQHLGYLTDPLQCKYDPTQDATVLCTGVTIGGVTGTNATPACVNAAQANAFNKIWYGQTADGSVPDPALDNSSLPTLSGNQLWFGLTRGSNLSGLAGNNAFPISADMVALELQDPTYSNASFTNATGNGVDKWKTLSYAALANAAAQGNSLQAFFGNINTDNPDLTKLRDAKAKVLHYHGLADTLITPMGSIHYYTRMSNTMGGYAAAQTFDRMFLIPGMGHCSGVGSVNGVAGPANSVNSVPLPASGQLFASLVDWVENGNAPTSIVLKSANASASQPVCMYPTKATYSGSGAINDAANYSCK
ncbi:MAG: Feruloyl esterase, partial [Rhizobacter sp.]|nr:Feruloyl esterase [Rhizobacter sp.]